MENKRHNFDSHWKTIITELFEDFVHFFLPKLYPRIDFSIQPIFLQQELEKIIKDETMEGKIINDKLVKVKLKNGEDRYILIHIEIQSSRDLGFQRRMFKYFCRIFETYEGNDITAIAVYTGKWRPKVHDRFVKAEDGIGLFYIYHSYWIEEAKTEELKNAKNPFALAVLAAKNLNSTKKNPELRLNYKLELISLMEERKYTRKQMFSLLTFIKLMLILPKKQELKFQQKFKERYVKEESMHPRDKKSLADFSELLHEIAHGMTFEERLKESTLKAAYNLLKAGASPKV